MSTPKTDQPIEGPYRVTIDDECNESLEGPNGFDCSFGEPEDCTWGRDGHDAVVRLNEQHAENEAWRKAVAEMWEWLDKHDKSKEGALGLRIVSGVFLTLFDPILANVQTGADRG